MQFEVLATCHTTRARVSRMKLARRSFNTCIMFATERLKCRRWCHPIAHVHAGSYSGGYQGSDRATNGVTWSNADPQQYLSP